ncbi:MAG: hypothetical protein JWO20_931 [Candidatus Angelobacter sp.]|nr:hypothetical protein [Candidatus Angelobacter sp.]
MSLVDVAFSCIRRGWYVFPCVPGDKMPIKGCSGYLDAANEEGQARQWWERVPNANVGIAPGRSGLTVLDIDHGIRDEAHLRQFLAAHDIPETFAVRTGRRPEFAVQLYYSDPIPSVGGWELAECKGDVRGIKGHVMGAGSIHPDSGEQYAVLWDLPIAPVPNRVRALRAKASERGIDPTAPIVEWRNDTLYRVLCKHRANGADEEMVRDFAFRAVARMPNPLDEEEVERIIQNACKQPVGQPEPIAVIGTSKPEKKTVTDWRELYHTFDELENAPPVTFLIEGFLTEDAITAIAAPVAQRKSLIALNVVHALLTGEKLFDQFSVTKKPARVLYLCPEMGIQSFSERLKRIGLMRYVGKTLFCRTMSSGTLELDELTPEQLDGAVVILDTAIRFLKGDENSSQDMRLFAESIFRIMKDGAASVVLLHHSVKGTKDSGTLSLDNAMRGSGELGAFVASCWATRLQDPTEPYKSASYLVNVKQRDFKSDPFEITSGPDCRLHILSAPGDAVLKSKMTGNRDGKEDQAIEFIRDNPDMSVRDIEAALREKGIKRGRNWISQKRALLSDTGVTLTQ